MDFSSLLLNSFYPPSIVEHIYSYLEELKFNYTIQFKRGGDVVGFTYINKLPVVWITFSESDEGFYLGGFYNAFQNLSPFNNFKGYDYESYRILKSKINFKGLGCSLLKAMLEIMVEYELATLKKDKIFLEASGEKEESSESGSITDQRKLVRYYELFGFKDDPEYLEKYDLAYKEFIEKEMPNDSNTSNYLSIKYDVSLSEIPMEAWLDKVIEGLKKNCLRSIDHKLIEVEIQ